MYLLDGPESYISDDTEIPPTSDNTMPIFKVMKTDLWLS